jgi:hypothetical protein
MSIISTPLLWTNPKKPGIDDEGLAAVFSSTLYKIPGNQPPYSPHQKQLPSVRYRGRFAGPP